MPIDSFFILEVVEVVKLLEKMKDRLKFVESRKEVKGGFDALPEDALEALKKVVSQI